MPHRMFEADNEWVRRIHAEFLRYADVDRRVSVEAADPGVPTRRVLADLLEVAFWASLITNEGRPTRARVAAVRTAVLDQVLAFKQPVPFTEEEVAKLAPAAWSTGWLAVDMMQHPPCIWGISTSPIYDRVGALTLDIADPGVVRVGFGRFQPFVVFAGQSIASPIGEGRESLTTRLRVALGKDLTGSSMAQAALALRECQALEMLARMVVEDRHGGTLLVVANGAASWRESLDPFTHELARADVTVRDSIVTAQQRHGPPATALAMLDQPGLSEEIRSAVLAVFSHANWNPESVLRPVARLAAVDGAVVLTPDLSLLGFGAMINTGAVPDVYRLRPGVHHSEKIHVEEVGGARHQSAVRFVGQHRTSVALVISHDGQLSMAHWSPAHQGVLLLKNAEWWI